MCQFSWLQLCTSPWQLPHPWFLDFRPPLSASCSSSKHWDGWDKRSIMSYAHWHDKKEEDLLDQVWEPWVIPALPSPSAPNLDPQNSPCPYIWKDLSMQDNPTTPSFLLPCSSTDVLPLCAEQGHIWDALEEKETSRPTTAGAGSGDEGGKGLFPWLNQRGSSIWAKPELEWKYQTSGYRFFLLYPCSFLPPREKTNNNRSKTTNNLRFNTRR